MRIRSSRTLRVAAAVVATSLVAAACGGDDDAADEPTDDAAADESDDAEGEDDAETDDESGDDPAESEAEATIRLWLNGSDTPDEMVDHAIEQFNAIHPNVEVQLERQQWTGLVERLTTALSSSDSPDLIEFGNTQAQTFEAAGAVIDLTEHLDELGGDDFLQSLLEAGTYDGSFYAAPYYAGARIMIYRTDLFEEAGVEVPTSMDEMLAAGIALQEANADVPNFSGIYTPGRNWHAALSYLWEFGGDIAAQDDGEWVGQLSTPESIEGLAYWKSVFDQANQAPADADDAADYIAFCNGEVGMMPAPGWKPGQILNEDDGCPDMEDSIGVFPQPGLAPGTTAPVFLGGSNLAIPTNSEHHELALDLLSIMVSPDYQQQFATSGVIPALKSELANVAGSDAALAQAEAAANSRFVPTSEHWAGVEAGNVLQDMLTKIAQGGDIAEATATADAAVEATLNS